MRGFSFSARAAIAILILIVTAFAFQNCGQSFQTLSSTNNNDSSIPDNSASADQQPGFKEPGLIIKSRPKELSNFANAEIVFETENLESQEIVKLECSFNLASFAACSSPVHFSNLKEGIYTFDIRVFTSKNNEIQTRVSWKVDLTPSLVSISSGPEVSTTVHEARFEFSVSDLGLGVSQVTCQIDGQPSTSCSSPMTYTGLALGDHTFKVTATDSAGNVKSDSYLWKVYALLPPNENTQGPLVFSVAGLAVDGSGQWAYIVDSSLSVLFKVDLKTGFRKVISFLKKGNEPRSGWITSLAVNRSGSTAWVLSDGNVVFPFKSILKVDLKTGRRELVSQLDGINAPSALVLSADESKLYLIQKSLNSEVFQLDLATGQTSTISGANKGTGPNLSIATAMTLEMNGKDLFVTQQEKKALLVRINIQTGDRTVISSSIKGTGPDLSYPSDIKQLTNSDLIVLDSELNSLVRINPLNGDRTIFSSSAMGPGDPLTSATLLAVGKNDQLLVGGNPLFHINIQSGNRSIISNSNLGSGPPLPAFAMKLNAAATKVFLSGPAGLFEVDVKTGDRKVISSKTVGSGAVVSVMRGFDIDSTESRAFVIEDNSQYRGILEIDLKTGARKVITGNGRGTGPIWSTGRYLVVSKTGTTLYLTSGNAHLPGAIFQVDIKTGNRTLLSSASVGSGYPVDWPESIFLNSAGNFSYTTDYNFLGGSGGVFRLDLNTGNRTLLTSEKTGLLPPNHPIRPRGITVNSSESVAYIGSAQEIKRFNLADSSFSLVTSSQYLRELGAGPGFTLIYDLAILPNQSDLLVIDGYSGLLMKVNVKSGDRQVISK